MRRSFVASSLAAFSIALALTAWWVPVHFYPWSSFYNEVTAIAALLLAVLVLLVSPVQSVARLEWAVPRAPLIFLVGLSCVPLLQLVAGTIFFAGDAFISFGYLFLLAVSLWAGHAFYSIHGDRFVVVIAFVLIIGAVGSIVFGLHQWLGLGTLGIWSLDIVPGARIMSNMAQPNNFATLCMLGFVATVYLREKRVIGVGSSLLLTLFLMMGVAMTQSRMTFFVILVLTAWRVVGRSRAALISTRFEIFFGLAIYLVMWMSWGEISELLYLQGESNRLESAGADIRLVLWQQLLDAVLRGGWLGWGWGQVSVAQLAVALDHPPSVFTEYSHNLFVDLLVWNGLVLGTVVNLALLWWVWSRTTRLRSIDAWFSMGVILAVGVHAMFEFPHAYAYFLIPVGLAAGVIEVEFPGRRLGVSRSFATVVLVAFTTCFAFTFSEYSRIESDYRLMRMESAGLAPRSTPENAPRAALLTQLGELVFLARTSVSENMSDDSIARMGAIAQRFPYPPALYLHALALGLNNRADEAARQLALLQQLHPPVRSEEARTGWMTLSETYPQLRRIALPPVRPE